MTQTAVEFAIKDQSEFHKDLGVALGAEGKFAEAEQTVREAIRLNPKYEWSHFHLGRVLVKQARWEDDIVEFREALRINPRFSWAETELRDAIREMRNSEAEERDQEALSRPPTFAEGSVVY